MALGEFELIDRYFRQPADALRRQRGDVPVGIGDDAALLAVPPGMQLVAALDTLVEGRHFLPGCRADSVGHRALAVNLSDLAAMGALPAWYLLALTLPRADEAFIAPFARGMLELAARHGAAMVGGDTTGGPLAVSVQVLGLVEPGQALLRSGGRPGDLLFVSGTPGDAAGGLQLEQEPAAAAAMSVADAAWLRDRFLFPTPRVALGRALRGIATACIDVSDGLAADAGKLALASNCAVRIDLEHLPCSPALRALRGEEGARRAALCGGDDYELCFTVPPGKLPQIAAVAANVKCPLTCIGSLVEGASIDVRHRGIPVESDTRGYDHFDGR